MRPGYLTACFDALRDTHGIEVTEVVDVSVGASTSFIGLMELLSTGLHQRVDLLLYEYALNDANALNAKPELIDLWGRCYEGTLRLVRKDNPRLPFVSIILGSRKGKYLRGVDPISAGTHAIARRYDAPVIDVCEWLIREHGERLASEDFYGDTMHYSRPESTEFIGGYVADRLAEILEQTPTGPYALPAPVYPDNYSNARYVTDLERFSTTGTLPAKRFKNSRFDFQTKVLEGGDELRFQLNGVVLALHFISEPFSGIIQVDNGTRVDNIPTMRQTMVNTTFPWLLGHIVPELHFGVKVSSAGDQPIRMRLAPPDDRCYDDDTGLVRKSRFAMPKDTSQGLSLALIGILYKGRLLPVD
jgi:hypothetical protein